VQRRNGEKALEMNATVSLVDHLLLTLRGLLV